MGSIVLYIMEWAFALIVLLTIYKAAFSGTTLIRFNRFYLLGATVLSALLPLLHITIPDKTPVVSDMAIESMEFAQELTGTFVFTAEPVAAAVEPAAPKAQKSVWAVILVCGYSAYVLMLLVGWSRSIIRARRFLSGKQRRRVSRTVWLVTHDEDFGPFSWMNYIVISDTENGFARRASLRHEFAHIRLLHSADLVFLLACTVVNPVCWLVLQEIKIVHEFEADSEVINRYGIRNSDYQKLLIMRTVGAEAYALASSFNLNIKKRIIMLNKNQTSKSHLMWLLLLVPMLGMTSVLFARTEKTLGPDDVLNLTQSTKIDDNESLLNSTTVRISGKIVDRNGNPIEAATISVMPDAASLSLIMEHPSDKNGEFSLTAKKGQIVIIAKDDYSPIKITVEKPVSDLTVTLEKPEALLPQLKAGDIIQGVVTDAATGAPLMMANIFEMDEKDRIRSHAITDPEGNFSMRIVNPDNHFTITKEGYADAKRPISNGQISLKKNTSATESDEVYMVVDQQPEFPGGAASLMQYLARTIRYPKEAHDDSIQGRVLVTFIIGKDGSINDAEVVQPVHPLLDAEALRAIREMPKWEPGYQNGEPVKVKYTVPINFRLSPATAPSAQWIVLYDAKKESGEMDQNVMSFFVSSLASANIDLKKAGIQETPQVKALLESLNSLKGEAESMQQEFTEQMNKGKVELDKLAADIERERPSLSESQQASRDQELMDLNAKIRGQYQELQLKMNNWMDETEKKLQPKLDAAWQSISKNGAYVCLNRLEANPVNDVIVTTVTTENLDAALKEFFEGRRGAVAIRYSDANQQLLKSLLTEKYSGKTILYMK